jgi:hypothetical protein
MHRAGRQLLEMFRWALVPDESLYERRTRMHRNLLVGMGALACLALATAPAHAQVLNSKTVGTAPKVTITQYVAYGNVNVQFAVVDPGVPIKQMSIKMNGRLISGPAAGPNPGTFLVNFGSPNKADFPAGSLVECFLVDAHGRKTYGAIQLRPWP